MIGFEHPWALAIALPWSLLIFFFARAQRRALSWIQTALDERFRPRFSRYSSSGLRWHMGAIFIMGCLLILAISGMHLRGRGEGVADRGRLLLLVDGSASMLAEDAQTLDDGDEPPKNRFELARTIAQQLAKELDEWDLALVSFSGVTTLHLPLVHDRLIVEEALRTLEYHSFYQNTGSSFAGALDAALHFVDPRRPDLQVLLLSDGEMPRMEDFTAPLDALASQGIPVHGLSLGSEEGETRTIFDFRDVIAKKEENTALVSYHTRRDDRHLQEMAKRTGAYFGVASDSTVYELLEALRRRQDAGVAIENPQVRSSLAQHLLGAFLLLFLLETLVWGHGRTQGGRVFDLRFLGPGIRERSPGSGAFLILLTLPFLTVGDVSCRGKVYEAHHENEIGIAQDGAGLHAGARIHYERSAAFAIDREIPTFNRARSLTLSEEWSQAHDVYQEALELQPDLARAHYNDGIALYRWGEALRDPRDCHLERTQDLWSQSLRRFRSAGSLLRPGSPIADDAAANHRAVRAALTDLAEWIESPPEHCPQAGAGGAAGDDGDAGESSSSQGEQGEPPPSDESNGEDRDEQSPPPDIDPESRADGAGALSSEQLEQIRAELERIAAQASEDGKYHRRTLPEQFGPDVWNHPDPEIWW